MEHHPKRTSLAPTAMMEQTRQRSGIPAKMLQHAGDTDVCGTFTPEDDSPTCIIVGARASTERLRALAAKHHLEPESLLLFARRH